MKHTKYIVILFVSLFAIVFSAMVTKACSMGTLSYINTSSVVFEGRVIEHQQVLADSKESPNSERNKSAIRYNRYVFEVDEWWRGGNEDKITAIDKSDLTKFVYICVGFQEYHLGEKWLIMGNYAENDSEELIMGTDTSGLSPNWFIRTEKDPYYDLYYENQTKYLELQRLQLEKGYKIFSNHNLPPNLPNDFFGSASKIESLLPSFKHY